MTGLACLCSAEKKGLEHPCAQQLCRPGCVWIKAEPLVLQQSVTVAELAVTCRGNPMPLTHPLRETGQQAPTPLSKYNSETDIF